jgi:hypothetical protein
VIKGIADRTNCSRSNARRHRGRVLVKWAVALLVADGALTGAAHCPIDWADSPTDHGCNTAENA